MRSLLAIINVTSIAGVMNINPWFVASGSASISGGSELNSGGYSNSLSGGPGYGGGSGFAGATPVTPPAKYAASAAHPVIYLWKRAQNIASDSAIWTDKNVIVVPSLSFQTGYYEPIPGFASPPSIAAYNVNGGHAGVDNYNTLNGSDKLDVDAGHLTSKIAAHAAHDAQLIADCLYKQGLLLGSGPYDSVGLGAGSYGGAFVHNELFSDGGFLAAHASWSFTNLVRHPDDAALVARSQTLKIDASHNREDSPTVLFKLTPSGGINGNIQTTAGRAAIEAQTDGVRPGNYHHLVCTNGIAAAAAYTAALIEAVAVKCSNYDTGSGGVQLCRPARVLHDFEEFSGLASVHSNGFINAGDAPAAGQGYYLTGVLWHVQGDHGAPHSIYNSTTIFIDSGGPQTYQSAIQNDPTLSPYDRYAPNLATALTNTADIQLHWSRLWFQAADYAIDQAFNTPWKAAFPATKCSNYEMVVVKNDAAPYTRVGVGGTKSIQKHLAQDLQAPSLYGDYDSANAQVLAIKNAAPGAATAAAVAAWNSTNLAPCLAVLDALDTNAAPIAPYIWGVNTAAQLQNGTINPVGQWGGDRVFFKAMVKGLWQRGIYEYVVFAGDPELTYAAFKEAIAEIAVGNFA